MKFRVTARTILHLGSDLISSDGIAFYELVKNSLDARSPDVRVDVLVRMPFETYDELLRELGERREPNERGIAKPSAAPRNWRHLRETAIDAVDEEAPEADELIAALRGADNKREFVTALREANRIDVDDDGTGMSEATLERVYLTIGTGERARERDRQASCPPVEGQEDHVILGEKGLGRLSAMRLGDCLEVITATAADPTWNVLNINWNDFADAGDEDISSIDVKPEVGAKKGADRHGTIVRITALTAAWTYDKLDALAREHFSKLVDPFSRRKLPLKLTFNAISVEIPPFSSFILDHAHGVFDATLEWDKWGRPVLSGIMDYRLRKRRRPFEFKGVEVATLAGEASAETLKRMGPFKLEVYWFNRRVLKKIEGIGDLAAVRRLLASWAGGVSLYRDGYRVNPYGGPKDDWLDLDRDAFSTSGFKLNRGQIVGRALISKAGNRYLVDQSNREGLKDTPEKEAFVGLLGATMEYFRGFVVQVDEEINRANRVKATDALDRFRAEDARLEEIMPALMALLKLSPEGRRLSKQVTDAVTSLREAASDVETASRASEQERSRVMHLASVGLLIEILAHELYRATAGGLKTIASARTSSDPKMTGTQLRVLDAQLRTLQKRLKVLDPLSTNARQTKEEFDLGDWVTDIVEGFAAHNSRAGIGFETRVSPRGSHRKVRAVKGMFVQIVENLLSNSVYWIKQQNKYDRSVVESECDGPIGTVHVLVEPDEGRVTVTDDGPGIPEDRREIVFEPFFTTKKQKQGRGLGLYIGREIAAYHGASLTLGDADDNGYIHSVILELGKDD
ncbi:ATP-binding protein [Sphingobium sp. 3R8]|uniref:sensor histidine kinase n=1 Tax=Sphingobium sp. 3R8 TaxID=2874921 RepID=UPI001CCB07F0|nr:sensor histidine kinase [Sphingobium sp. 3R8]MBZ9648186.1 ATP-binding protein [Sphingobium sp. 3R8]